jgi:C1A family cysteine protease
MKFLCRRDFPDSRDFIYELQQNLTSQPQVFKLPFLPEILNQGGLASCVANQVSNALKYCLMKQKFNIIQPSRLFIYYFGRVLHNFPADQDTGLSIRNGIQSVAKYGTCKEPTWPYNIDQFKIKPNDVAINEALQTIPKFQYVSIPNRLDYLKSALMDGYPIVFGLSIFESFCYENTWKTGNVPIPKPDEKSMGGHCVAAYGWVDEIQSFLMMNSWGTQYGIQGWFYLPYTYVLKHGWDFWQIQFFNKEVSK